MLSVWSANVAFPNRTADCFDLWNSQFPGQNDDVGVLGVESNRFDVRQIELRRDVYLEPDRTGIQNGGLIGGDHGIDPLGKRPIQHTVHLFKVLIIEDRVDGQVGFYSVFPSDGDDPGEVIKGKIG